METGKILNFPPIQRWTLVSLSGGGLLAFVLSHRTVSFFQQNGFYPPSFHGTRCLFWLNVGLPYILILLAVHLLIRLFEKQLFKQLQNGSNIVACLGPLSVRNGFILSAIIFLLGCAFVAVDRSLLNVWDVLFFVIFVGLYYIGSFFYFYYSVPLKLWEAGDPNVELEKLKMEYEEQKMYLRIFLWVTVSFFVSQVFVILKSKFEPYLKAPDEYRYLEPIMAVNALQICFLLVTIWGLVFSQVLGRMEQVKLKLMTLKLGKSAGLTKDEQSKEADGSDDAEL